MWRLWLDDQSADPTTPLRHPPEGFVSAVSSADAIRLTIERGVPAFISFDHDLGDGDDAMVFLSWLIEHHYDDRIPDYDVHSANPIGRANIISKLESWRKSRSLT